MSQVTKMLPIFFPKVSIVAKLPDEEPLARADGSRASGSRGEHLTVRTLCRRAGLECRVTGPSAERQVFVRESGEPTIHREPGPTGRVSIGLPAGDEVKRYVLALGTMAYAVFDYASRESLRGRPESRTLRPLGRPRMLHPASGAERTRKWRATSS